jgi:hypothetical protein
MPTARELKMEIPDHSPWRAGVQDKRVGSNECSTDSTGGGLEIVHAT